VRLCLRSAGGRITLTADYRLPELSHSATPGNIVLMAAGGPRGGDASDVLVTDAHGAVRLPAAAQERAVAAGGLLSLYVAVHASLSRDGNLPHIVRKVDKSAPGSKQDAWTLGVTLTRLDGCGPSWFAAPPDVYVLTTAGVRIDDTLTVSESGMSGLVCRYGSEDRQRQWCQLRPLRKGQHLPVRTVSVPDTVPLAERLPTIACKVAPAHLATPPREVPMTEPPPTPASAVGAKRGRAAAGLDDAALLAPSRSVVVNAIIPSLLPDWTDSDTDTDTGSGDVEGGGRLVPTGGAVPFALDGWQSDSESPLSFGLQSPGARAAGAPPPYRYPRMCLSPDSGDPDGDLPPLADLVTLGWDVLRGVGAACGGAGGGGVGSGWFPGAVGEDRRPLSRGSIGSL